MEKTMYDTSIDAMKRKKEGLTLDLNGASKKVRTQELREGLLSSPDVGLLKLGTPELERFIIHHQGGALATTPSQILFPKSVTEEQEAYARGFVDALVELHMKQSPMGAPGSIVCVDGQGTSYVTLTPMSVPHLQANMDAINALKQRGGTPAAQLLASPIFSRPGSFDLSTSLRFLPAASPFTLPSPLSSFAAPSAFAAPPPLPLRVPAAAAAASAAAAEPINIEQDRSGGASTSSSSAASSSKAAATQPRTSKAAAAARDSSVPQTVPNLGMTPPLSPIDMSNQEQAKLERKREKNRNAAQKCRSKKLERISRLEDRVAELKRQNAALTASSQAQKEHVNVLRQQIVDHVNNGCQIMVVRDVAA